MITPIPPDPRRIVEQPCTASRFLRGHFLPVVFLLALSSTGNAAIRNHVHPRARVDWAVTRLIQSLQKVGVSEREADVLIERDRDPSNPESFTIAIDGSQILVSGTDSTGVMYGVLELAEQIENSGKWDSWNALAPHLTPTSQSPYLQVRADNSFLHDAPTNYTRWCERLHLKFTPRVIDDTGMWKQYIDMLAGNRFNFLDLHGGYNPRTTKFFNLLPALVAVPGYEKVGNRAIQRKNLAALREVVHYAKRRGVSVALMNYSAKVEGLSGKQLTDYTKKAVLVLKKELPDLGRFGFRVGESGEELDFFRDTYSPVRRSNGQPDIRMYTRSWRTSEDDMERLAKSAPGGMDVEVKYNGEHLGLPYQGILGPAHNRYGYGDFLHPGSHYRVIWQVRANGTHRYWTWAQSEFIRRAVRSFKLGDACGFTLEPPTAYYPAAAAAYYRDPDDQAVFRYIWQKHWPWYFAWGRLAYNPSLPEATLVAGYTARFGEPGAAIYDALQQSGRIVPLAMSYRFVGPDQRNTSPETQTTAFDPEKKEPVDILTYARNTPMDSRSFVGIDAFVKEKIIGTSDGRIGPGCVARLLSTSAAAARLRVAGVPDLSGRRTDEWRLLRTDILAACYLGEYHAARILGTMELDSALRTGNRADYKQAQEHLSLSRLAWGQLTQACDSVYKPLEDPMVGQTAYTWGTEIERLRALDATAANLWAARLLAPEGLPLILSPLEPGEGPSISVAGLTTAPGPNGEIRLSCQPTPSPDIRKVTLWLKRTGGAEKWSSQEMTSSKGGTFIATAPPSPDGYLGLVEITNAQNESAQFPSVLQATPYWWIRSP